MPSSPHTNQKLVTYADDIQTATTHKKVDIAKRQAEDYLVQISQWTQENNLKLNEGKTQTTLFTPDPAEYNMEFGISINNTILKTEKFPKILGVTLGPKLTYTKHINATIKKARPTINILKALAGTDWGKDRETIANTYKIYTRPILEYANSAWCPILSNKQMQRLQIIQNTALRIATGHTKNTNVQHLHDKTYTLPIQAHTKMLASQFREKATDPLHPLHDDTLQPQPPRLKKQTIFNSDYTLNV